MDKVLDKLNLYEFWGILFSGLTAISTSIATLSYLDVTITFQSISIVEIMIGVITSYIIGLLLHEIGSWGRKAFYINIKNPYKNFLNNENYLSNAQIHKLKQIAKEQSVVSGDIEVNNESTNYTIYSYCKKYITIENKHSSYEKKLTIYGLSRTLYVYFVIWGLFILFSYPIASEHLFSVTWNSQRWIGLVFLIFIITVLLYRRTRRYYKLMLIDVLTTFLMIYKR